MALVLIVLGSSLKAAHESARERLVEVRAGARVLARAALLIETPQQGLMLRLRDLSTPLPQGVAWPPPVRLLGELYLPLKRLDAARFRLDERAGVLVFEAPAGAWGAAPEPPLSAYRYRLEPAEGGAVGDLIWLGEAPLALPPEALEPAAGPPPKAAPRAELPQAFKGSAGEPLPGPVRRRAPLEPPLVLSQEWREWLVSVVLNGARVSEGALVLRGPDGAWA
ncbi:MAG: hypothetical protein ACREH3_17865, partial [Geminicoccales bacterium]